MKFLGSFVWRTGVDIIIFSIFTDNSNMAIVKEFAKEKARKREFLFILFLLKTCDLIYADIFVYGFLIYSEISTENIVTPLTCFTRQYSNFQYELLVLYHYREKHD